MKLTTRILCFLLALALPLSAALADYGSQAVDISGWEDDGSGDMPVITPTPEPTATPAPTPVYRAETVTTPEPSVEPESEDAPEEEPSEDDMPEEEPSEEPAEEEPAEETSDEDTIEGMDEDTSASGERAPFKGWSKKTKYQYVRFGKYPKTKDGEATPLLWRVLTVNEEEGTALLFTEYVIEMYPIIWVDSQKDRDNHNFRALDDIRGGDIYGWMNSTMIDTMFTEAEQATLKDTGDGVYLYILDRHEMTNPDYGFSKAVYGKNIPSRIAPCTEYAKSRGVLLYKGGSTYWVNGLRPGNPWRMSIVGYNGHISYAGCGRQNVGIRPGCWVYTDQVTFVSGSGTESDPYIVEAK